MKKLITICLAATMILAIGSVAVADQLWPLNVGSQYEYRQTDSTNDTWTVTMNITEQVTLSGQDYFHMLEWNYYNDSSVEDYFIRSTEDAVYSYNPGGDYLEFLKAPVGTQWILPSDSLEYNWQVSEIVAVGSVTVPYGTFAESYTTRAYECVDPNNLSLGQSPYWYDTIVPGVGFVKEVDYWTNNAPGIEELTGITVIPEPATICLLGLGALNLLRKKR